MSICAILSGQADREVLVTLTTVPASAQGIANFFSLYNNLFCTSIFYLM